MPGGNNKENENKEIELETIGEPENEVVEDIYAEEEPQKKEESKEKEAQKPKKKASLSEFELAREDEYKGIKEFDPKEYKKQLKDDYKAYKKAFGKDPSKVEDYVQKAKDKTAAQKEQKKLENTEKKYGFDYNDLKKENQKNYNKEYKAEKKKAERAARYALSDQKPERPLAPSWWKLLLHFFNHNLYKNEVEGWQRERRQYMQQCNAYKKKFDDLMAEKEAEIRKKFAEKYKALTETEHTKAENEKILEEEQKAKEREEAQRTQTKENPEVENKPTQEKTELERQQQREAQQKTFDNVKNYFKDEPEQIKPVANEVGDDRNRIDTSGKDMDRMIAEKIVSKKVNDAFVNGHIGAKDASNLLNPENPRFRKQVDNLMKSQAFKNVMSKMDNAKKERIARNNQFTKDDERLLKTINSEQKALKNKPVQVEKPVIGENAIDQNQKEHDMSLSEEVFRRFNQITQNEEINQNLKPLNQKENIKNPEFLNKKMVNDQLGRYDGQARSSLNNLAKSAKANGGLTVEDQQNAYKTMAGMAYMQGIRDTYNRNINKGNLIDMEKLLNNENVQKSIEKLANNPDFQRANPLSPENLEKLANDPKAAEKMGKNLMKLEEQKELEQQKQMEANQKKQGGIGMGGAA